VKNNREVIKFLVKNGVRDCADDDGMYATQVACKSLVNDNERKAAGDFQVYLFREMDQLYDPDPPPMLHSLRLET
jgi:hypothetical protein